MNSPRDRQFNSWNPHYRVGEQIITENSEHHNLIKTQHYQKDLYQKPFGISNIGNICFLNSILQFLYAADSFKHLLMQKQGNVDEDNRNMRISSILKQIFFFLTQKYKNLQLDNSLKQLIIILENININYKANRFEDALQTLINILNMVQQQDSNITKCFNIQFQKKCRCMVQTFKQKYIQLSEQQCRRCGQKIKRCNLNFAKYIIYLNYKRLLPSSQKIEILKINGKSSKIIYKLISSINFNGQSYIGHYTARRIQKRKWYYFNDSLVRQANNHEVFNQNGCILLYELIQSQNAQVLIETLQIKPGIETFYNFKQNKLLSNMMTAQNGATEQSNRGCHSFQNPSERDSSQKRIIYPTDTIQLQKNYVFKMTIISSINQQSYFPYLSKKYKFIDILFKLSRAANYKFSYFVDIDRKLFHDERSQLQLNLTLSKYFLQKQINARQLYIMIQIHLNNNIEKKYQEYFSWRQRQEFSTKLQKLTSEQIINDKGYLFYDNVRY